ncbi:endonuclease/exonuclease/phosphatase family protein [Roseobacter sp. AzwK-3b]|uniref:endonuclease/exonuclease/phosphatase family protein n=1 Tax=Roseobacter sp. AzwK-3b TaxID=351016 RepID=UPI0001569855|nr:endonuclease/exonuclease/phosphatase family protein [Roseobacter sp. AzwK-3b]EDM71731.1 endonuclease/exonuclease/phosphatase family protein [Roseobacter sp. AzwK-3b]
MRIATYNVEWFDALFDDEGALLADDDWSRRHGVTRADQLASLGIVFTALDADAVMVIEAPDDTDRRSTVAALESFADFAQIRARRAVTGFANDTQQEIALLYDPDVLSCAHDPKGEPTGKKGSSDAPRFDGVFRIDLDIDDTEDLVAFSKPPLELACTTATGVAFRMIGAHLKSKAPHKARSRDQIMRMAIANRRKQQAQAVWLRHRIEEHLAQGETLIVLGDLNDGPGLDEYEHLFGRSSVEIVMGEGGDAAAQLFDPHARRALTRRIGAMIATARFYLPTEKRYLQALLDYIMVSSDLEARQPRWRIWHPFDDPGCFRIPELREALLAASDHFPVTMDVDL